MTQRTILAWVGGLLFVSLFILSPALADNPQPKMQAALSFLEQAKTSPEPIPLLQKARTEVQEARRNKGGRRGDIIETIDDAIATAQKGEDPSSKIIKAIAQVRSGMTRGNN